MSVQTLQKTDQLSVQIGMDAGSRKQVAEALSSFLASTYLLYLKTLYYHWNVTGSNFVGLHELFQKQYEDLQSAGDDLAERVRALGHYTPGTVTEFLELSKVQDDQRLPASSSEMVRNLLSANEMCSQQARAVLKVAEEAEDEVTIDMMVDRMTQHDKAAWMLRATLE
jgi:starvation-inducible DNA-binding protein